MAREIIEQRKMKTTEQLVNRMKQVITKIPNVQIDYLSVVDPITLQEMKTIKCPALIAGAIRIGKTRLIDNVIAG
jgi:pantothenate synthetase